MEINYCPLAAGRLRNIFRILSGILFDFQGYLIFRDGNQYFSATLSAKTLNLTHFESLKWQPRLNLVLCAALLLRRTCFIWRLFLSTKKDAKFLYYKNKIPPSFFIITNQWDTETQSFSADQKKWSFHLLLLVLQSQIISKPELVLLQVLFTRDLIKFPNTVVTPNKANSNKGTLLCLNFVLPDYFLKIFGWLY